MLILLNENDGRLGALDNIDDFCITEVLDTGETEMSFEMPIKHDLYKYLAEESCILANDNRYVVKSLDERGITAVIGCRLDLSTLQSKPIKEWLSEKQSLSAFMQAALSGTGWFSTGANTSTETKTVELKSGNVLDLLCLAQGIYGVIFKYDSKQKKVTVTSLDQCQNKGVYFTDELNLKECTIRGESFDFCTRLYPYGKEGLTISSVNGGKEYVENHTYSRKIVSDVWIDERYQLPAELKAAAEFKLSQRCLPNRTYTATVVDLASLNPIYSALTITVGDKVTLVDRLRQIKVNTK